MVSGQERTKRARLKLTAGNLSREAQRRVDRRVIEIMATPPHAAIPARIKRWRGTSTPQRSVTKPPWRVACSASRNWRHQRRANFGPAETVQSATSSRRGGCCPQSFGNPLAETPCW